MAIPRKPLPKPNYGRRLLPSLIDERAQRRHAQPYAAIPVTNDPKDGFRDISYGLFANAINRCALWLIREIGTTASFDTLVYIGAQDLRYQILCIAACKTGHVVFFTSPRNSLEAHLSLLNEAAPKMMIVSQDEPPIVTAILRLNPLQKLMIPSLDVLLNNAPVQGIPFGKTFDEYRMAPFLLLHTSGSTGTPKIVTLRHGYTTTADANNAFDGGSELSHRVGKRRVFNPFPNFHMMGIMWSIAYVCWVDSTIVLPPPVPLTAAIADAVLAHGDVHYAALPPSIVVDLAKDELSLKRLSELEGLAYAGGPLPNATGDLISKLTTIHSSYGATEMMAPPLLPKKPENWPYLHFDIEHSGIEFRRTDPSADTYELVIVRHRHLELLQAIFVTFPDLQNYHSKDLFTPHPTEPNHWSYAGRRDDIIVFSSGEKLNPVTMEGIITGGIPDVSGCLVVGQGKFQSALLIETKDPPSTEAQRRALLESMWPVVQRANHSCGGYGKIAKDFVLFTKSSKPLARAAKGTVQRQRSVALYQHEIDDLFLERSSLQRANFADTKLDLSTLNATVDSLHRYFMGEMGLGTISMDDDLFTHGVDSLQTITLIRLINDSLQPSQQPIEMKQVYENPTIKKLATSLHSVVAPVRDDDDELDTWIEMQQMFHDFASSLGGRPTSSISHRANLRHHNSPNQMKQFLTSMKRGWRNSVATDQALLSKQYDAGRDHEFLASMVPPDGGKTAWLQVLASFLININTYGFANTFGAYQAFYEIGFLSSYSAFSISWIGTIQAALLLIIGVFSGPLFDRGLFKPVLIIASLMMIFALIMLSFSSEYYQILLTQGVLLGVCSGLLYIPSVALIPMYFRDRRGLALGLALSGASVGGIVYPIIFRALLNSVDFGWATRVIALIALVTLAIATILIRPMDQIKKPARDFFELGALREIPFSTFLAASFLVYCAWLVPYFLTPPFAISLGTSQDTAFYLLAIINTAQLFGRVVPACLSDYYGGEILLLLAEVLTGILGLSWITVDNLGGFIEFQIFYGFVSGMVATLPAVVMPYICPSLDVLGTRMGMIYGAAGVGVLIGNPVAMAASDMESGDFLGAQLWMGLCALVGAGFCAVTTVAALRQRHAVDAFKQPKSTPLNWVRHMMSKQEKGLA